MSLKEWLDEKFYDIASKIPTPAHRDPASFACGYNVGYKQALLDMQKQLERLNDE